MELEWEGIPTVAVVHEAMRGSAQAITLVSGMPDQRFLTVDYPLIPLAIWTDEEIAAIARQLAPQVVDALTAAAAHTNDKSTDGFDGALAELQGIVRADGGDLVVVAHHDTTVELRLVVETAHCVECIMPRTFLEQVALNMFAGAGVTAVHIDDPREAPDFVMPG